MKTNILTLIFCIFFGNIFAQNTVKVDYAIQRGDNLTSIAKKFGMNIEHLKELNPHAVFNLKVGDVLHVEQSANAVQTTDNKAVTDNTASNIGGDNVVKYKVRSGDGLNLIAKMYQVNVEDIKNANPEIMVSGAVKVGQMLIIPIGKNVAADSNTAKSDANTPTNAGMIGSTATVSQSFEPQSNIPVQYKVVGGDNLMSISKKFNSTPEIIKQLNQMSDDNIKLGQILKILPK